MLSKRGGGVHGVMEAKGTRSKTKNKEREKPKDCATPSRSYILKGETSHCTNSSSSTSEPSSCHDLPATKDAPPPNQPRRSSTPSTAIHQSSHLIRIQDILLQNSLKQKVKMIDTQKRERQRYSEICKKLKDEVAAHAETKRLLAMEQEKAALALTDVEVLSKQLEREKSTFENAFGLLKSQAVSDSTKTETLQAKCSALETLVANKDENIAIWEEKVHEMTQKIKELQQKMKDMQQKHKTELQEAHVRAQQEIYLAKSSNRGLEQPESSIALPTYFNNTIASVGHARAKPRVYFK